MKKNLLVLTCMFICTASFGQNQWQWLNPKPSGFACVKIVFTDSRTGYILNSNGDLLKTTDQGNAWKIIKNFPGALNMGIADSTGVIAANAGLLYVSTDNGNNWDSVNPGIHDRLEFVNIERIFSNLRGLNSGELTTP